MSARALSATFLLLAATFASFAAAAWEPVTQPTGDQIVGFHPAGDELYCASYLAKVYVSTDHAGSWTEVGELPHGTTILSMVVDGDWILVSRSTWAGKYRNHRTDDGWGNWEVLPDQDATFTAYTAFLGRIFASRDGQLVATDDHGLSWTPAPPPDARRVLEMFTAQGWLFAATFVIGQPARSLYRTADGVTWEPVTGLPGDLVMTAHGERPGAIYVVHYRGGAQGVVYRSDDAGASFVPDTGFPLDQAPSCFASAGPYFAVAYPSTQAVTCFLRSGAEDWEGYVADLPDIARPFSQLAAHDGYLYKTGGTVLSYRAALPYAAPAGDLPTPTIARLAVQPNPFNPRAQVSIDWGDKAGPLACLAVYDARGRLLLRAPLVAGQKTWEWDGRDGSGRGAPSGTYLLRLEAGGLALAQRAATLVR